MIDTNPPFSDPLPAATGTSPDLGLRAYMPISQQYAYFDHAAVAPIPLPAAEAIKAFANEACQVGDTNWLQWSQKIEQLRVHCGELLSANPLELAFVPNTTIGIGLIAEGWRWQSGDSVVVPNNEFPSNLVPWRNLARRGVQVREVAVDSTGAIDLDAILAAIDGTTRMVAISWVGFASGWRIDVAKFCSAIHERGALVFLDAIQGLGAFPLDVRTTNVDFLAADGHKWLLGPEGAGMLYVAEQHLEALDPLMIGWRSLDERGAFDPAATELKNSAARYEGGSANMVGLLGLERSVRLLLDHGAAREGSGLAKAILANVAHLEDELRRAGFDVLLPRNESNRSGILGVALPPSQLVAARNFCLARRIVTSVRAGRLRISTHAYNNTDDVNRLVNALKEFVRGSHG